MACRLGEPCYSLEHIIDEAAKCHTVYVGGCFDRRRHLGRSRTAADGSHLGPATLCRYTLGGLPARPLPGALAAEPRISSRIGRATIDRLTSPWNYLGLAAEMVDRVLASAKRSFENCHSVR